MMLAIFDTGSLRDNVAWPSTAHVFFWDSTAHPLFKTIQHRYTSNLTCIVIYSISVDCMYILGTLGPLLGFERVRSFGSPKLDLDFASKKAENSMGKLPSITIPLLYIYNTQITSSVEFETYRSWGRCYNRVLPLKHAFWMPKHAKILQAQSLPPWALSSILCLENVYMYIYRHLWLYRALFSSSLSK